MVNGDLKSYPLPSTSFLSAQFCVHLVFGESKISYCRLYLLTPQPSPQPFLYPYSLSYLPWWGTYRVSIFPCESYLFLIIPSSTPPSSGNKRKKVSDRKRKKKVTRHEQQEIERRKGAAVDTTPVTVVDAPTPTLVTQPTPWL